MSEIFCKVCKKWIGRAGWPSHVAKEKRIHGEDIYHRITRGEEITGPLDRFTSEKDMEVFS